MLLYKGDCWNGYQSLNIDHLTIHNDLGFNTSKTFINVRQLPKNPGLYWFSSDAEWQSYMNHLDVFLPRMFECWDNYSKNWWVGNPLGFKEGATKDGEKFSDFQLACQRMNITPIYCIGASEENCAVDWIGRSPMSLSIRLWLKRFCREFAIFINKKYKFKNAVLEIWNEPIECFTLSNASGYIGTATYMAKGWKSANLGYKVWINSNDISHQGYIDQLLQFNNLMMYTDAVATHIGANDRDDEWTYRYPDGASYIQMVNRKLHSFPLPIKYKVKQQILSEMSPVSGLNPYNNLPRAKAQLKMFKERFEYFRDKVSGYNMLFVNINDIVHTGNRDQIITQQLYDNSKYKSGHIISVARDKYDYMKEYNNRK